MRLAWFTPLPPSRSGVAAYSAELLPLVAREHDIDVFLDAPTSTRAAETIAFVQSRGLRTPYRVLSAHDFLWLNVQRPYDLVVYHVGNAACHDYMWAYLVRHPGLVILHDGQLHHARAHHLLDQRRSEAYRLELRYNHPDASPGIAGLVIAGLATTALYVYPLRRVVVERSRIVAVHSESLAEDLREQFPRASVRTIQMGVADPFVPGDARLTPSAPGSGLPAAERLHASAPGSRLPAAERLNQSADCRLPAAGRTSSDDSTEPEAGSRKPSNVSSSSQRIRQRHHISADAVIFAAYGGVTPEKRISPVLKAFAALCREDGRAHLVLVGSTVAHYEAESEAADLGIRDRVTLAGYVDDRELPDYLAAADVALCLRWPSTGETSAFWLRCLAAGKPTVITDLASSARLATLDPRTWRNAGYRPTAAPPLAVSIDIVDEEHSLTLAMSRLAKDATLRAALGRSARAFWASHHTLGRMRDDYRRAIAEAVTIAPAPFDRDFPAHFLGDGTISARQVVSSFGVSVDFLQE